MKIAVIADDLTGAGDTGVQFAKHGLHVTVLLQFKAGMEAVSEQDVLVLDTDSRSLYAEAAYQRAVEASRCAQAFEADVVFKKIDSTLRGNLGSEIDAVYDTYRPDFVVIAPAYPEAGRLVREGRLYVHGTPLHETEFASDPKTPITESYIPELLRHQTKQPVEVIPSEILAEGRSALELVLQNCLFRGICYLLVDSDNDDDLKRIVSLFGETSYSVVWVGSAGLAQQLAVHYESLTQPSPKKLYQPNGPILAVIGSVSSRSRRQLDFLLSQPNVRGIRMEAYRLVSGKVETEHEVVSAVEEAIQAIHANFHTVLYSSGDVEAIRLAQNTGALNGMTAQDVSDTISRALGESVFRLMNRSRVGGIILTGGDTARQVCSFLKVNEFRVLDEVESGVPIGCLVSDEHLPAVTKAGGFGSDQVLLLALELLNGGLSTR
ncbi:four-carbon acid sugar kinase family protein [Paenibacillus sp. LjRoot56]|uniref:four-carbon acid sugar kinase family protein n=1 Tax=Paenibacillus sp. LjRoot56 TaxID=3342333 RepID=UPI003ECF3F6C